MKQNQSFRHHYIPKFFTKEFANENGMLHVYVKEKDEFLKNLRSPKSIFYEYDRNSINITTKNKSSAIEDVFYKNLDDFCAPVIKKLQKDDLTEELASNENIFCLIFFIINQFWRLPQNDNLVSDILNKAEINIVGDLTVEEVKSSLDWNKLFRLDFYKYTMEFIEKVPKPEKYYTHITDFEDDLFVIGDHPFIFKDFTTDFTDFLLKDFCIALTPKRMFMYSLQPLKPFNGNSFMEYNAAIIEQSEKSIASNNVVLLEYAVEYYKSWKETGWRNFATHLLFEKN